MELSEALVEQIRKEARTPGKTLAEVALKYGLDVGHVRFIKERKDK